MNLFGFVRNNGVNKWDYLGYTDWPHNRYRCICETFLYCNCSCMMRGRYAGKTRYVVCGSIKIQGIAEGPNKADTIREARGRHVGDYGMRVNDCLLQTCPYPGSRWSACLPDLRDLVPNVLPPDYRHCWCFDRWAPV